MEIRGIDSQFRTNEGSVPSARAGCQRAGHAQHAGVNSVILPNLQSCLSFDTWQPFNPQTPAG